MILYFVVNKSILLQVSAPNKGWDQFRAFEQRFLKICNFLQSCYSCLMLLLWFGLFLSTPSFYTFLFHSLIHHSNKSFVFFLNCEKYNIPLIHQWPYELNYITQIITYVYFYSLIKSSHLLISFILKKFNIIYMQESLLIIFTIA